MVTVAFSGSRRLGENYQPQVREIVQRCLEAGVREFLVGDAMGADAFVRSALETLDPKAAVRIFMPREMKRTPRNLTQRSKEMIEAVSEGGVCIAFFGDRESKGTFNTCHFALARGLHVVAFPCGFPYTLLPSLGDGNWKAVQSGGLIGGFKWTR